MTFLDQGKIDNLYQKVQNLWGTKPNRYVAKIPKLINSGKVLDVGVGEGRNALFLAEKGFDVTGIDISKVAIEKFLKNAKNKNLSVEGHVADALEYDPDTNYDVVICTGTIHYFPTARLEELMNKIKGHTKIGGINLLTAFTKSDEGFKEYPSFHFFKDEEELREIYRDWEIIECERYQKTEEHGGSDPHVHDIVAIIARKK